MQLRYLGASLTLVLCSAAFSANEPAKQAQHEDQAPSDCGAVCVWVDKAGNQRVTFTRAYVSQEFAQPAANLKGLEPVRAKDERGILNTVGL